MITQETMDKVKEKLQLPVSKADRKSAAMGILLDATDCSDERRGGYNIPRLDAKEARVIVYAIQSEMNGLTLSVEREKTLLDELEATVECLRKANDQIAELDEKNRHLAKFATDIISTGQIGVR